MPAAQLAVTIAALIAGTICFLLYVYATMAAIRARAATLQTGLVASSNKAGRQPRFIGVDEVSSLAEALSKLADSLSRASPALTSLIGALAFFALAAVGSGALHS